MERGPGQIWESNSTLLMALLQRLGYDVADRRVVVDQPGPLRAALQELAEGCDVVVSTGGVSAGDSDWIRPLVDELGASAVLEAVPETRPTLRLGPGGGACRSLGCRVTRWRRRSRHCNCSGQRCSGLKGWRFRCCRG